MCSGVALFPVRFPDVRVLRSTRAVGYLLIQSLHRRGVYYFLIYALSKRRAFTFCAKWWPSSSGRCCSIPSAKTLR